MAHDSNDKPLLALTWKELRRRKVVRVALAYAAVAWIVLQLGEITFEPLGLPAWVLTWTILLVILAFPVVLVLAWMFDLGDRGLTRDRTSPALGAPARVALSVAVLLTVGAVAWWLTDRFDAQGSSGAEIAATGGGTAVPASASPASSAPPNSIAVLPFDDMSPDADQAWFADGLAEELLDRLARVEGLRVAARTSSFALRDTEQGVVGIGKALNVATVLEGSVRKADGRIRITAQLIDAGDGFHLWTETYERPDQGIFELQDEITTAIVEQLRKRIPGLNGDREVTARSQAAVGSATTRNVQAHELYLQGRLHWRQRNPAALARAAELFRAAIELDPGYARAWSGLADAQLLLSDYGTLTTSEAVALAEPAAVRALELAPGLGEAWATLGLLRMNAGQYDAAEGNFLEALRLDPNYDMAAMWLGGLYGLRGKLVARMETLSRAHALSPLDPAIVVNLASTHFSAGRFDECRKVLSDLLAVTPDSGLVRRRLAQFERLGGRLAEAVRQADMAWRHHPDDPAGRVELASALAAVQRHDEAVRLVSGLPANMPSRSSLLFLLAMQRDPASEPPIELRAMVDRTYASTEPVPRELRSMLQLVALSSWWRGDKARALDLITRLLAGEDPDALLPDDLNYASQLMFGLRGDGRTADADLWRTRVGKRYADMVAQGFGGPLVEYELAVLDVYDGREDAALDRLETAVEGGFSELWLLDSDPRWAEIRDDGRFRALRDRLAAHVEAERRASAAVSVGL